MDFNTILFIVIVVSVVGIVLWDMKNDNEKK